MLKESIKYASNIIKNWWVVAFPTETVYWLWASIYDKNAIKRIFEIKWRPQDNPLIVHIDSIDKIKNIASNIPEVVYLLWSKFWPWPLTVILEKNNVIDEVTAWTNTVAIRIPNNDIALKLIKESGTPIAAPSANLSWKPSPTSAKHVKDDLWDSVDYILDWWETTVWLESTVIDLTVYPYLLLRPWGISFEQLKEALPDIEIHQNWWNKEKKQAIKCPWMKYRHYSPDTEMFLFDDFGNIYDILIEYKNIWKKIWIITTVENEHKYSNVDKLFLVWSTKDLNTVSKNLFNTLREVDKYNLDVVFCESFEEKWMGLAIMDRLKRACLRN